MFFTWNTRYSRGNLGGGLNPVTFVWLYDFLYARMSRNWLYTMVITSNHTSNLNFYHCYRSRVIDMVSLPMRQRFIVCLCVTYLFLVHFLYIRPLVFLFESLYKFILGPFIADYEIKALLVVEVRNFCVILVSCGELSHWQSYHIFFFICNSLSLYSAICKRGIICVPWTHSSFIYIFLLWV